MEAEESLPTDHMSEDVTDTESIQKGPSPAFRNWWEAWGFYTILKEWLGVEGSQKTD